MDEERKYKEVCFVITVPKGNYCSKFAGINEPSCRHFDNYGGHPTCGLGFDLPDYNHREEGYLKAVACMSLMDAD